MSGATLTAWWIWPSTCHRRHSWVVCAGCLEMVRRENLMMIWCHGGMAQHFGLCDQIADLLFVHMRLCMCPFARWMASFHHQPRFRASRHSEKYMTHDIDVWTLFLKMLFVRTICKCIEWIYSWQFMTIQVYYIYFYLHMNPLHWIYVTKLWFHLISFARTHSFGFSFRGFALLLMVQCTLEVKMLFCFRVCLVWSDTAE